MTRAPRVERLVLLGHPVAHSLSPAFQNAALRHAGLAIVYEALDVPPDGLASALAALRQQHAAGNVTIPHKEAVRVACDRLSPVAERVGAVNTFWIDHTGALVGDNTDVHGFEALASALAVQREQCVVGCIGSGGAAAAVCAAVERWPGASVRLAARSSGRARRLVERFGATVLLSSSPVDAVHGAQVVVNATPTGLTDDSVPVPVGALPRDARVMDLVYRPGETAWVRAARAAGHRAADGREMLLQQGGAAFERWFGIAPDLAVMRAALDAAIGRRAPHS